MIKVGDVVKVKGWKGVAFRVDGPAIRYDPDLADCDGECGSTSRPCFHETGETIETEIEGQWNCHMVGDDRKFTVDEEDMTPLKDTEYCGSCGQIGCPCG